MLKLHHRQYCLLISLPGAFLGFADGGGGRNEARRTESGGGVLGDGAAAKRFYYILSTQDGLS